MNEFGALLRNFRESCKDPAFPTKRFSQGTFGELVGRELGTDGYSSAAVSDWELGKSKINADHRLVLTALIKVLYEHGGLKTVEQANQLLKAGNYRDLNAEEIGKVFTKIPNDPNPQPEMAPNSRVPFMEESFLTATGKEFKVILAKAKAEGPEPWWPRALAALLRTATDRFSLSLGTVLWVWVWLIAWWLIAPSLHFSSSEEKILSAMQRFVAGFFIVPVLVGILVNPTNNEYWRLQSAAKPLVLWLYTFQGAAVGFMVGYFLVFPLSLAAHYLHLNPSVWFEFLAGTTVMILGNMGARVVPHNLWRAYGRLNISDGWPFFSVALVGPLWAFFFLEFYPVLLDPFAGILIFLLAITALVFSATRQSQKT
jgi:hypothetical protein